MKVKDYLNAQKSSKLEGLKVRTPKLVVGYIFSVGNCIVFLNNVLGTVLPDGRLYPQIVACNEDIQNWDIVGENVACNCDILTSQKYTFNAY